MLKYLIIGTVVMVMCACSQRKEVVAMPPDAGKYSFHDMEITWKAIKKGDAVEVQGTAKNLRLFLMRDVELKARIVDTSGNVIAEGTTPPAPNVLRDNEVVPFSIVMPVTGAGKAERIVFRYTYFLADSPPVFGNSEWVPKITSFEAPMNLE